MSTTTSRWQLRTVPAALVERYRAEGWWTDESLGDMVQAGLARNAATAFRIRSRHRPYDGTFADVDRAARALAAGLVDRGVRPGDVVVCQLPNWVEAGITFWAAAYAGATIIPIVHFYGPKEVGYILESVRPSVVVTADAFGRSDYLATYSGLLPEADGPLWLVVGNTGAPLPANATAFADLLAGEPLAAPVEVDPDLPAVVGFTSGTTTNPKGVVHSHRTIGFETRQLDGMFPRLGPPQITGAPVGHFIGMLNAFLVPLQRDYPVTLVDEWDPARVLALMLEEDLTVAGGATYFMTSLLDHPDFTDAHREKMHFAGLGGSSVPYAVTSRLERMGVKPYRSYGSTEHPSITGCDLTDPVEKRLGTDGPTREGCEIRLADDGEIFSRGPDLCLGYTDPELTAKAFDAEGWYRTGDIGVLDADGYLSITDRATDMIIRGGENIAPQEVEDLLLGLPGVAEVSVVGVPDDRLGERAAAVFRLLPGAEEPTVEVLRAHLETRGLARQKWPEQVVVVQDFPRTASGKVQKFKLRQAFRDGTL